MAKQIGLNGSNGYFAGFYLTNSNITSSLITKIDSISQNVIHINYYNLNQLLLLTTEVNTKTGISNVLYTLTNENTASSNNIQINSVKINKVETGGCGQATADCLADAYSKHGWVSVWATVQTAFVPATAVALAAVCAAKNCL